MKAKKVGITKSVRIYEDVHTELKIHVARHKLNMIAFVSAAIIDKIKADRKRA